MLYNSFICINKYFPLIQYLEQIQHEYKINI